MGVIFSYIDENDVSADGYTTAEQDEVITFKGAINKLFVTNAGTAAMYIVVQPGGAQIYLEPGDSFKSDDDALIYSIQVLGAAGQKIRYYGVRG